MKTLKKSLKVMVYLIKTLKKSIKVKVYSIITFIDYLKSLYGSNPLKKKNPNSNAAFKNITKLVRLETGGKGRRSQRWLLNKYSMVGNPNDGY